MIAKILRPSPIFRNTVRNTGFLISRPIQLRTQMTAASANSIESLTDKSEIKSALQKLIDNNAVFLATKSYCPYCARAESLLSSLDIPFENLDLDLLRNGDKIQSVLFDMTTQSTVPNVFINQKHIGGNSDLQKLQQENKLLGMVSKSKL